MRTQPKKWEHKIRASQNIIKYMKIRKEDTEPKISETEKYIRCLILMNDNVSKLIEKISTDLEIFRITRKF